jgi:hypothetical protein
MLEQERLFVVNLPYTGGLQAHVSLCRCLQEQQDPEEGDEIRVKAVIKLPIVPKGFPALHPSLRFNQRVNLAGEGTHGTWGYEKDGCRQRTTEFTSTHWVNAFDKAEKWAKGEVQKLVDALEKRHAALVEAEKDPQF